MFKLHLTLLMGFLKMAYAMSGSTTPEASSTPSDTSEPDILPLILIQAGRKFINPTRMEDSTSNSSSEPLTLTGTTDFSGGSKGYQVLLCGAKPRSESNNTENNMPSDYDYCNYPIKFKKSDPLKCAHEPEPILTKMKVASSPITFTDISCGFLNEGKKYHFVYQICMTEEPIENEKYSSGGFQPEVDSIKHYDEFEIYQICIKEQTTEVFFTEHRILSPRLLDDRRLHLERKKKYKLRTAKNISLDEGKIEKRYLWKTGIQTASHGNLNASAESPEVIDITPVYKIQKFVPSEDFAFALWRKATFDHFNVKKMEMEQSQMWDYISNLIRKDAIKHNREYYIHTSAYKLSIPRSSNQGKPARTKSVYVWVKTVYYLYDKNLSLDDSNKKNKAIAIIMDSDLDEDPDVELQLTTRFGKNLCENDFVKFKNKSVRCCSMINTKSCLVENSIEVEEDLWIESFYDEEDDHDQNQPHKKPKLDLNIDAVAEYDT